MLQPDPKERLTLAQIQQHPWFTRPNSLLEETVSKEERTGTLVEALMGSLIAGGNLPLAVDLHSDGQRAEPVAFPAASQPSALSSHYHPDAVDMMELDSESAPLPLPPATMSAVGHGSLSQGAPAAGLAMTQLGARRRATLTQNPGATQFQALWAGMTQWTEVAGASARFSAQTTRFFSAGEPWQVVPAVMRVLRRAKGQTKVYAFDPRGSSAEDDDDASGSSSNQTRIDLRHQEDMDKLVAGMDALSPDPSPAQPSKEEVAWRRLLDASSSSSSTSSASNSEFSLSVPTFAPYRSRGARIMIALTDKRKCRLAGNVWVDPLPPRRQHGSTKTLVLLDRSSGSPLEWRRLFKAVLDEPAIANLLVPM